jgi:mono/diheme cytochrome c family protein
MLLLSTMKLRWIIAIGLCLPAVLLTAAPQKQSADEVGGRLYKEHIRPLFEEHCQTCHSAESKQGGFDLSSSDGLLRGGGRGPAITPGNARTSLLYKLVAYEETPAMPYKADKLSKEAIALLELWINLGAPTPAIASATTPASSAKGLEFFADNVRPVLQEQCFNCHGGKFKQAGLSLQTRATLLRGSDNGPVVVPGKPGESLLIKKIRHEHEPGMPYKGAKLADATIAKFVDWVESGVPYDRPLETPGPAHQITSLHPGSDHWAFKPVSRPSPPRVKNPSWVRNPIDAFVAAKHDEKKLTPLPPADRRVLIRRLYLDLIGLPPTPQETQAFLEDKTPDAYEKIVDRLLNSPRHGERWGRHWMDIWRYSDWYGFGNQVRNSQQHIWHWRDWIIESLNQDKGYDRMILEMLAGDEVAPNDLSTLRATGYLARSWYRFNRNVWLQDTVEHVSAGFLGITLKCARCHDHKYDPIAQEEYYKFRAFFEPYDVRLDPAPGEADQAKDGIPRIFDAEPREATTKDPFLPAIFADTYRFIRGDEKSPDKEHPLTPAVPEALGGRSLHIEQVQLPLEAANPVLRAYMQEDLRKQARQQLEKADANLAKAQDALAKARERAAAHNLTSSSAAAPGGEHLAATTSAEAIDFDKQIKPILEKNCFSCHRSGNAKSGLSLDSLQSIQEGGRINGPAVLAAKSSESPLLLYIQGKKKPRMPFGGGALPEADTALIQKWIDTLPEEDPQIVLQKATAAVTLAEKQLVTARANVPAVEARIEAEKAKLVEPPDPRAQELAKAANQAERQFQLVKAEENLWKAQQKLTEVLAAPKAGDEKGDKERDKKVAAARRELDVAQAALTQAGKDYTPLGERYPKTSTGRRLALARWIVGRDNPLTARVAINHIWLRHFGKPLVPTMVNFGLNGKPPSHPELLNWLAAELMETGWSMKGIHRLMVTSNTYRMQSSAVTNLADSSRKLDPENQYLWRMNPRRMEAEIVRDSLLSVAGKLDTTMGGPELDEAQAEQINRRSLYFRHTPDSQAVFLKLFNAPDPTDCYKREESVVPQQALALANSKLSHSQARLLTRTLSTQVAGKGDDSAFIRSAFETVLGRLPSATELAESAKFLAEQTSLFRNPEKLTPLRLEGAPNEVPPAKEPDLRAKENLVHVLFNHNDFVTIR